MAESAWGNCLSGRLVNRRCLIPHPALKAASEQASPMTCSQMMTSITTRVRMSLVRVLRPARKLEEKNTKFDLDQYDTTPGTWGWRNFPMQKPALLPREDAHLERTRRASKPRF